MPRRKKTQSRAVRLRSGATVVEFAIVAPVLFLFLFGLIEWGRMVMVQQSLTNAAREGCRMAILSTTGDHQAVVNRIRSDLKPVVPISTDTKKVRVSVIPTSLVGLAPGTPVSVSIDLNMFEVSWLPRNLLNLAGNPVLQAHANQVRE
jgi:hypothetical protein